ncbi:restriction endonuclease [Streptomyces sp. NPDC055210]
MNGHTVLYDPHGRIDAQMLPPDRTLHEHLIRAVLTWSEPAALQRGDYEQVGLLLTGAAYAVAADVREHAARLPANDGRRLLAEIVLDEADACLSHRSRTLRALYERLERLHTSAPAPKATATPNRPPDTRSTTFSPPRGTRGPLPLFR